MKTREMISYLKLHNYVFIRNGAKHKIFSNGKHNISIPQGYFMKDRTALRIKKEIERNETNKKRAKDM